MQEATIATIISGLLSGGIAAFGAWIAVKLGVSDLEAVERRRQKISCVINLYGLRYVLSPDPVQRDEDRTRFMFEIGRAGALFADDAEVQKKLRDFYGAVQKQDQLKREIVAREQAGKPDPQDGGRLLSMVEKTTDLLLSVIREMSNRAKFSVQALSDSEVRSIFLLPLANPNGISTVIVSAQQQQPLAPPPPPHQP
jgi:hypothetical protein